MVVDEDAVVRGRLLCNGEQPRIKDFARNVQSGRSERDGVMNGGRIWLIECAVVLCLGVLFTEAKGKTDELMGSRVVALRVSSWSCQRRLEVCRVRDVGC